VIHAPQSPNALPVNGVVNTPGPANPLERLSRFGAAIAPDPLADPFVDVLSGESLRAKPPPHVSGDGMGRLSHNDYDGGGGGSHAPGNNGSTYSGGLGPLLPPG